MRRLDVDVVLPGGWEVDDIDRRPPPTGGALGIVNVIVSRATRPQHNLSVRRFFAPSHFFSQFADGAPTAIRLIFNTGRYVGLVWWQIRNLRMMRKT